MSRYLPVWTLSWLIVAAVSAADVTAARDGVNLVRDVPAHAARVSVDSSFTGYRSDVLADGRWIAEGEEAAVAWGDPQRLGNHGNTWVSQEELADHWMQVDWPMPVRLNEIRIVWSQEEWLPRCFQIRRRVGDRWEVIPGVALAWEATDRESIIAIPACEVESLRVVQPRGGHAARTLMAAQEVSAFLRSDPSGVTRGTRELSEAELGRLLPKPLRKNIARLHEEEPAASVAWTSDSAGKMTSCASLVDADRQAAVPAPADAVFLGMQWPISHMVDQVTLIFADEVPALEQVVLESHDGRQWRPVPHLLNCARRAADHQIVWDFEPLATQLLRVRFTAGRIELRPAELEVSRYLPSNKSVWPARLTQPDGLQREMLAQEEDPSFEQLAQNALSMTPVRAFVGLKDDLREIGVAWDGTLLGRETIRLLIGQSRATLGESRDTLRRTLLDGWLPAVQLTARVGDLEVTQTVFSVATDDDKAVAITYVRVKLRNLSSAAIDCPIQALVQGQRPGKLLLNGRSLCRGDDTVLCVTAGHDVSAGDGDGAIRVEVVIEPRGEACIDFVHPTEVSRSASTLTSQAAIGYEEAVAQFRAEWQSHLAGAVQLELPEPRVQRLYRAVLAQLLVNADGNVMPYGAAPSVYEGSLFGIEESYPLLALAMWGLADDARRYLDGTYLTPEFLRKVDTYTNTADRHQQYRNGLQPHYAVSAYRLSRDRQWMSGHLALLKSCAEWTIAERRGTMQLEDGARPLHWGLLPKWAYGGDIENVECYALYANFCCWRGLVDTSWLCQELGEAEAAERYATEAAAYRGDIERALEGNYRSQAQPPFLPLRLYADQPDEQMDYYQLFAGCMLDVEFFPPHDRYQQWICDYLEADNRTFCLLPRFRRDAGSGGLDALYGKGYVLAKFREDAVREFLLGFYAFLAFNMDHDTFISRETNVLYASDLHVRSTYPVVDVSDPVPCSSAVALHWLRHMLVTEQSDTLGASADRLLLLSAIPRDWLADGKVIRFEQLPTEFGPVSLHVQSEVAAGRIVVDLTPPQRQTPRVLKLRLRHPQSRHLRSVTVNGNPMSTFDPDGEWITLDAANHKYHIVAEY